MFRTFFSIVLAVSLCYPLFAVGELDLTFNVNGWSFTQFSHPNTFFQDLAVQRDGKTVVAGYAYNGTDYDIALVRLDLDGRLDLSFDGDGKLITNIDNGNDAGKAVAIQPDGKIVVAGTTTNNIAFDFAVVRYNTDGSLDTSFDDDGIVKTRVGFFYSSAFDVAIQNDGKIVVAGDAFADEKDLAVVRYQKDGKLDPTFGNGGGVLTSVTFGSNELATSVAVQNDGKIVACGVAYPASALQMRSPSFDSFSFLLVRYKTDGTLDPTFGGGDGIVNTTFDREEATGHNISVLADGKLLASGGIGQFSVSSMLAQFNSDGKPDSSFGTDGLRLFQNEPVFAHVVQPDGKILVSRRSGQFPNWSYGVMRLLPGGSIDNAFGSSGVTTLDFSYGLALQNDGKIIAGDTANESFAVARLTGDSPVPNRAGISGRVVTQLGRPVTNAKVTVINLHTNESKTVFTGRAGNFTLADLTTNDVYKIVIQQRRYVFEEQTIRPLGDINDLLIAAK